MKYMLMLYGAQRDYDLMSGKSTEYPDIKPEDFGPMYAFMGQWNQELAESGELVDAQGHEDGDDALGAQAPADLQAVHAREHPVQHHDVGWLGAGGGKGLLAVEGLDDVVTFVFEVAAQEGAEVALVFDDEDGGH